MRKLPPAPSPLAENRERNALTVGLLETSTGTWTTELLGLAAAVVGNEEGTIELGEGLLEEVLGVLIDELLVVGDQSLGDGLTHGAARWMVSISLILLA